LTFGNNRYEPHRLTAANDIANGSTQGNQFALSVSAGYDLNKAGFTFGPYARLDEIVATIDGLSENSGTDPIQISKQRIQSTVVSLGGQASYAMAFSSATLIPTFRAELQQELSGTAHNVTAQLISDPFQTSFAVPGFSQDKSFGNVSVGLLTIFKKNVSIMFNYERLLGKDNYNNDRYTLGLRIGL